MKNKIKFSSRPLMQLLRKGYKAERKILKVEKSKNPFKIKENWTTTVRLELKWNDIFHSNLLEAEIVDEVYFKNKKFYLFKGAYYAPCFREYYARKVDKYEYSYLKDLIEMLLFLNPNPTMLLQAKIAECILQKFTLGNEVKSNVKRGEYTTKPVLEKEKVLNLVEEMAKEKLYLHYKPLHMHSVMYGNQYFTREEKISLMSNLRSLEAHAYYHPTITKAIDALIVKEPTVKFSFKELENLRLIIKFNSYKYATAKLIKNNLSEEHKIIIQQHDKKALFNKVEVKEKYKLFELMQNPTLDEIVKNCKVSRTDAVRFRKLKLVLK